MIKLCRFCGTGPLDNKPIYYNGKTYITNKYYALRVAGRIDGAVDVIPEDRDIAALMESIFPRHDELAEMRHAPHRVDPIMVTRCEKCRGYGITKKCPHCAGAGKVEFEKDPYTYECECQMCYGGGAVAASRNEAGSERCSCCQGFGSEVDERYFEEPERIGKARLSPDQMLRLSHLPLIAWAEHGINGHFFFFGGEGVLLGIVKPEVA